MSEVLAARRRRSDLLEAARAFVADNHSACEECADRRASEALAVILGEDRIAVVRPDASDLTLLQPGNPTAKDE